MAVRSGGSINHLLGTIRWEPAKNSVLLFQQFQRTQQTDSTAPLNLSDDLTPRTGKEIYTGKEVYHAGDKQSPLIHQTGTAMAYMPGDSPSYKIDKG